MLSEKVGGLNCTIRGLEFLRGGVLIVIEHLVGLLWQSGPLCLIVLPLCVCLVSTGITNIVSRIGAKLSQLVMQFGDMLVKEAGLLF